MKFGDLDHEQKYFVSNRISDHTRKVQNEALSGIDEGVNYLFFTNAGGAVAVLSFLGASLAAVPKRGPLVALAFFALGVILVGVIKAFRLGYFSHRSITWVQQSSLFYANEIDWETLNEKYAEAASEPRWPYIVGILSFACFILGSAVGFYLLAFAA